MTPSRTTSNQARLALWLGILLAAGPQLARGAEVPAIAVSTLKPEQRDVVRWIRLPGTVAAEAEVMLYAKVSGFLKDFKIDIGDRLTPGQVIGKLDAPEYEQDVKLAEAQLASAQADLASTQALLASEQLGGKELDAKQAQLAAGLVKAKAEASRSQKEYERTQQLAARDAATEREREFQEYSAQINTAGVAVVESQLSALKTERELWKKNVEAKAAAVEAARSKVGIARAGVERARIWNDYTSLTAPAIGTSPKAAMIVTKRFVSNGDLVTGGAGPRTGLQPIVTLASTDTVRAVTDVPENESPFVQAGTVATVSFYAAAKDKPIATKVARTSGLLSADARTLRVEVDVPNPEGKIKPGMMVNIEMALETHKGVLAVPASAVLVEKKGPSVFAVAGGKAKQMPVTAGFNDHGIVEIAAEGLTKETELIQDVQAGIMDGMAVEGREKR